MTNTLPWFYTKVTELSKKLVSEAVNNDQYTSGPHTNSLESNLAAILGFKSCIYVNSGTSALSVALIASGANETSKIATSGIGWIATPQAAQFMGAEVNIIDVENRLPLIDTTLLSNIYDFVIPVNYNGRQVDIEAIRKSCPSAIIVEDSCKSLFSKDYKSTNYSGSNGNFGCYSLGMISALPGIYGGLVGSKDSTVEPILSTIKWHGVSYRENKEFYGHVSYNFKSSNIHAALALGMLDTYEERIERMNYIYELYRSELDGLEHIKIVPVDIAKGQVPLLIDLICPDRSKYVHYLNSHDIPTCNYHNSLSTAPKTIEPYYCQHSNYFASHVFHPPCGPDQDLRKIEETIKLLKNLT